MLKALPTLFPNLVGTTTNPAAEFYSKFQRAADDHDRDFIKKYDEYLNSTLIFVSTLSMRLYSWSMCEPHVDNRLVCSPRSHPLSSSMFKASLSPISKK